MEFKRAKEELGKRGASATSLNELIECRLLHRTRRGEILRVELTHDVLTGILRDSRDQRRLRERQEEAEAKQREAEAMLLRRAEVERMAKEEAEASAREAAPMTSSGSRANWPTRSREARPARHVGAHRRDVARRAGGRDQRRIPG